MKDSIDIIIILVIFFLSCTLCFYLGIVYETKQNVIKNNIEEICIDNILYILYQNTFSVKYDPVTLRPMTCFEKVKSK